MTYKLNPSLEKIQSPVILILPDGERREYIDGAAVTEDVFNKMLLIDSLRAVGNTVEIKLAEPKVETTTWIGEEQTFFWSSTLATPSSVVPYDLEMK